MSEPQPKAMAQIFQNWLDEVYPHADPQGHLPQHLAAQKGQELIEWTLRKAFGEDHDPRAEQARHLLGAVNGVFTAMRRAHVPQLYAEVRQSETQGLRERLNPIKPRQYDNANIRDLVDMRAFFVQLAAAFHALDRLFELAVAPPPKSERLPWGEDVELLRMFQDLFSADETLAHVKIGELKAKLRRHGITVQDFDGTNPGLFAVGPHPDPDRTTPETTRPAVLGGTAQGIFMFGEALAPRREPTTPQAAAPGPAREEL
ncbi:hypothetical protein AB0B66_34000 [Catellatospora sp. NPDC049111]|uniref:hypothetical protein n=1 Tax=Catellatospora sp. NPDC049111 TaxID=3155271 RepID=UPI0033DBFF8F